MTGAGNITRASWPISCSACHPGITRSELQRHLPPEVFSNFTFMDTWQGALPTIMAATKTEVKPTMDPMDPKSTEDGPRWQ